MSGIGITQNARDPSATLSASEVPLAELGVASLRAHSEAVVLVGTDGVLGPQNPPATQLLDNLAPVDRKSLAQRIKSHCELGETSFVVDNVRNGEVEFELLVTVIVQCSDGNYLCFVHDRTLERDLNAALMASRMLFRDLVGLADCFVWSVNSERRFDYVSPRGGLGFTAEEILDRQPETLFPAALGPDQTPFFSPVPVRGREYWLQGKDGQEVCVRANTLPVVSLAGEWMGARGVLEDITDVKRTLAAVGQIRRAENALAKIVALIPNFGRNPAAVLPLMETLVCDALSAQACEISPLPERVRTWPTLRPMPVAATLPQATEAVSLSQASEHAGMRPSLLIEKPCQCFEETVGLLKLYVADPGQSWDRSDASVLSTLTIGVAFVLRELFGREG